ncbi:MAG: hypothetical protein KAT70_01935, partial [Thermoplasmata archaeon]|nr:hypothetical protein [Thermoplasmata archaeon]
PSAGVNLLSYISVYLHQPDGGATQTFAITMTLYDNTPTMGGIQIGQYTLPASRFKDSDWNTFSFSPPVTVDSSTHFFSLFTTADNTNRYQAKGDSNSISYTNGEAWYNDGAWNSMVSDLAFRTYFPEGDLKDLNGGGAIARVTSSNDDTAQNEWDPWTRSSWEANDSYQSEYIYESTIGGGVVDDTYLRITPVPMMDFYNYYDETDTTTETNIATSTLDESPVPELVTLTYNSSHAPVGWDVKGSVSGAQNGYLEAWSDFFFSNGANSGRVKLNLDATAANYADGNKITFDITRTGWYEPDTWVEAASSDYNSPVYSLSYAGVTYTGGDARDWDETSKEFVYIDVDRSLTITSGDYRVVERPDWENRTPSGGGGLNGVCYNGSGEVFAVGEDFTAMSSNGPVEDTIYPDQIQEYCWDIIGTLDVDNMFGQVFRPMSDTLSQIDVCLDVSSDENITLYLFDDIPSSGGNHVANTTLHKDITQSGWNVFEFSDPLDVDRADSYLFYLDVSSGSFTMNGSTNDPYTSGDAWHHQSGSWMPVGGGGSDLAFRTHGSPTYLDQLQTAITYTPLSWDIHENAGIYNMVGQSFMPTGEFIYAIQVHLYSTSGTYTHDLVLQLYKGSPFGTSLGYTAVPSGDFVDGWNTFFFTSPISVTPGRTYSFSIVSD